MVKFYDCSSVIKFTWDQVSCALWQKYPNPFSKHVLSEDVVSREIRDGKLYTRRLLTKTNHMPRWGERFVPGPRNICIVEESVVDPQMKTFTTYTRNIKMRSVMAIEERCTFSLNSENKKWTLCERNAWISSSIFGFSRPIAAFGLDRFKKNVVKSTNGMDYILEQLYLPDTGSGVLSGQGMYSTEKLRDTARKAKQMAKAKTSPFLQTN